jgi:hypothetical protein
MSKYRELRTNPPKLEVKENAREIKIDLVSCMCDNRYRWTIKKNEDGDYKIFTHGFAYNNWQIHHGKDDIEWVADEGNWNKVFEMINSGTSIIEKIKSR